MKAFFFTVAPNLSKYIQIPIYLNTQDTKTTTSFIKKRLQPRCFLVNIARFLRTPFSQNTSGRLLVMIVLSKGQSVISLKAVGLCGGIFSLKSTRLGRVWLGLCTLWRNLFFNISFVKTSLTGIMSFIPGYFFMITCH